MNRIEIEAKLNTDRTWLLEALYGIPTRLDLTQARILSRLVAERAATPLPPWKAVTGGTIASRVGSDSAWSTLASGTSLRLG